jgi:hypothetical protein
MVLANIAIACGLLFVWFEFVLKPLLEWGRHAGMLVRQEKSYYMNWVRLTDEGLMMRNVR